MSTFSSKEDFESSYDTLKETFSTNLTKSLAWRKWQLKQFWWLLQDNEDALLDALKHDLHRHPFESIGMDLRGVRGDILDMLAHVDKWSKGEAPQEAGFFMGFLGKAWIRKEPLGVCLVIGAWNFPLYTLLSPAMAAIAAGNCVLLKPSESASATQNLLVDLLPKYLDQKAIRIVTGGPEQMTNILTHKFNHIFYTGGSKVGRIIATAAAKHLTPVVLELGGQAPAIVTKTANLDLAAKRIAHWKLVNSGQVCLNVNHVFVDPAVHDEFVSKMTHWLEKSFLQNDDTSSMARIINPSHFNRIKGLLENTKGNVIYGGISKADASQKLIHPSIITNVTTSDSLMSEELFAPLIPVLKADVATAISTINSMPHPLGLYIFAQSRSEIDHILNSTTSGGVTINDVMMHAGVPGAPFGGVGESGYGSYHGKWGFDAFSHNRTVVSFSAAWMEKLFGWRYLPYKIENRKYIDLGKVPFKRGETMADQKVGKGTSVGSLAVKAGMAIAFWAILDSMTGGRLFFIHSFKDVVVRFDTLRRR